MKEVQERLPVVYILSSGRSGSTLLDLLLGTHDNIWTLGEAQVLPWELRGDRAPCGCGTPIPQCRFWQPILPEIFLGEGAFPIEHFRESHSAGRVIRWRLLLDILRRKSSVNLKSNVTEYGLVNYQYFRVVRDAAEKFSNHLIDWLVDASKDMYRLFWLQQSGLFDLRVIHLVKDPRAFVYSMVKKQPKVLRKNARFTGRWLVENWLFSYIYNDPTLSGKSIRVRYEDLASNPQEVLTNILEWLDLDAHEITPGGFRAAENHAISGNQMRWQNSSIPLDERWRSELPKTNARAIWALAWPLARSFGYRSSP